MLRGNKEGESDGVSVVFTGRSAIFVYREEARCVECVERGFWQLKARNGDVKKFGPHGYRSDGDGDDGFSWKLCAISGNGI